MLNIANPRPPARRSHGDRTDEAGRPTAASSNIATIDPNFRFRSNQKISMGYDHVSRTGGRQPRGSNTKSTANPCYTNLALAGPQVEIVTGRCALPVFLPPPVGTARLWVGASKSLMSPTSTEITRTASPEPFRRRSSTTSRAQSPTTTCRRRTLLRLPAAPRAPTSGISATSPDSSRTAA